ncbi:hypothetical protein AUH73_04625 [archaeon 13_1_40CM_4_53_4]|nr:MAG: hypothetical protein AUI07_05520 [archaeon 13_2_20CM_2_53_6]OLC62517.1 MAG: hypothetical protein AUH73_04625 [archaeon 13_1_40CM_4_53_4]TMI26282.1 MAG: universal stress protein [Candidatus Bathyarchaeota archaeon]
METKTMKRTSEHAASDSTPLFKNILVAVDGSESSKRAAHVALGLAEKLKAELIVLHAISPPTSYYQSNFPVPVGMAPPPPSQKEIDTYYAYARRVALGIVGDTVSEAKKVGTNVKTELPEGVSSVVETIINHAAKEHADLIIVGTRGLGGFKKMLIGSVSSGVISHANCPVLVVR